ENVIGHEEACRAGGDRLRTGPDIEPEAVLRCQPAAARIKGWIDEGARRGLRHGRGPAPEIGIDAERVSVLVEPRQRVVDEVLDGIGCNSRSPHNNSPAQKRCGRMMRAKL